jgi:hypothetical protein
MSRCLEDFFLHKMKIKCFYPDWNESSCADFPKEKSDK